MGLGWYGKWMTRWETDLTTRDTNRIVRPLEWGFDWLADFCHASGEAVQRSGTKAPVFPEGDYRGLKSAASPEKQERQILYQHSAATPEQQQVRDLNQHSAATPERHEGRDLNQHSAATPEQQQVRDLNQQPAATLATTGVSVAEVDSDGPTAGVGIGDLDRMIALNEEIVRRSDDFFGYVTPTDFRLEERHPELFPTNVRPETLAQDAEMKRQAAAGTMETAQFLRFTSAVRTPYPENDQVNARWYPAAESKRRTGKPKQAIIVMPQWNADAISHNALCSIFNRFGISALRLSKPYHDIRRPAELERSDYAMSANVGRTISACRQAVVDIRSCMDWLETRGYTQFGVLGTSLGSCYGFIAAAHDPRLRVCAFNHASTWVGDVVWQGQSTRHVRAAFEEAGLKQEQVRQMFRGISPMAYMDRFADTPKRSLVVHATWDLTFPRELSLDVLRNFERLGVDYVSKVLPCGHYTSGETPYKYIDGWYLGSFVYQAFRDLAKRS